MTGHEVSEKMFENNDHIRVYNHRAEADTPLGFFLNIHIQVIHIFIPPSKEASTYNLALIGKPVSEKMFESDGHIHVFSPGQG